MILTFLGYIFFILYDPLEFSTGASPTPSGKEMGKTYHCELYGITGYGVSRPGIQK